MLKENLSAGNLEIFANPGIYVPPTTLKSARSRDKLTKLSKSFQKYSSKPEKIDPKQPNSSLKKNKSRSKIGSGLSGVTTGLSSRRKKRPELKEISGGKQKFS